jgi:internalin A
VNERELLNLIARARDEGWEELDLSGLNLNVLPPEIGSLVNLKRLILGKFDSVTKKILGNELTFLPEEIERITNLEELSAAHNRFASIPSSINNLRNLRILDLNHNYIKSISKTIKNLHKLKKINLTYNQITDISWSMINLKQLQQLYLNANQIDSTIYNIGGLRKLRHLNLSSNQIKAIPESFRNLRDLQSLNLGDNNITVFPISICELSQMQRLDLSHNQIKVIPNTISKLENLKRLSLGSNKIVTIPNSIESLQNLQDLYLDFNQINKIPEVIWNLKSLRRLDLGANTIHSIPEIKKIHLLQDLYLRCNQIKIIPNSINNFQNLQNLYLNSNQINSIPEPIWDLQDLKSLALSDNRIKHVPIEILESQDPKRIFEYYFATRDVEKIQIFFEAKLLLVGEGESGKTSLARKLINPEYQLQPTDATQGIDILIWDFVGRNGQKYRINIWDFGGQSIYHQTHRFFLTQRSLYLLVADNRKENTDHDWWLQNIQAYGQDSPILLIQNEKNNCVCNLDYAKLRKDFDNLRDTHCLNLANNRGLTELTTNLQNELEKLIGDGLRFRHEWVAVRQVLTADPRKYINIAEYKAICREQGMTNESEMLNLSQLLHDLGVFLHFQDPTSLLCRQIILDRKWGTDAVYKILDNDQVKTNLGRFNNQDLQSIWQAKDEASQQFELLELMKKFKVCYEIPRRPGEYIAPHLLEPKTKDYEFPAEEPLVLHYSYQGFMPKGMMTRFIVEMHKDIENVSEPDRALVWKTGVVLQKNGARAEAIEDYHQRRITIRSIGDRARELINIVHHEFQQIHADFNLQANNYKTLIPCNCPTCLDADEPETFALDTLYHYLSKRKQFIECRKSIEDVDVLALIDNVIIPETDDLRNDQGLDHKQIHSKNQTKSKTMSMSNQPSTIFISYSHDSQEHKDLVKNLADKLRSQGLDCIIDEHIPNPKEGWPRWMLNQVEEAKFVLVVATETYHRRFRAKELPGKGKGAAWEGAIITQELYDNPGNNEKFIPIAFTPEDIAHIPEPIKGQSHFRLPDGYDDLYRLLTNQPKTPPKPLGKIREMPPE